MAPKRIMVCAMALAMLGRLAFAAPTVVLMSLPFVRMIDDGARHYSGASWAGEDVQRAEGERGSLEGAAT